MKFIAILLPLFLGALAVPTPEDVSTSLDSCRENAKSSVEICACFPGCKIIQKENGYDFIMPNATNLAKRQGCSNPRAFVTTSNTRINMGTTTPQRLYTTIFEKCGQHGCDPNPTLLGTTIIAGSGRNAWGTTARIIAKGRYRDWPDRDAGCGLLRQASYAAQDIQRRTPGTSCRPGADCETPDPLNQHYQYNYYQVDHWNDCGLQAHVEAEVKVDGIDAEAKACAQAIDAIQGVLQPLLGQWAWLFGQIKAAC